MVKRDENMGLKPIAVVDIDGTISVVSAERKRIINTSPIDWDAFYREDFDDEPIAPMVALIKSLIPHYAIYFCTSRRAAAQVQTQKWILKHFEMEPPKYELIMRSNVDNRPDYDSKIDSFISYTSPEERERVAVVFDDAPLVISRWRRLGYLCLTVCPRVPITRSR